MAKEFSELSRPERAEVVRELIARGGSDLSVALELGTTKNTIVAIRRDFGIAANYRPGFEDVQKSQSGVPLRMAAIEATRCEHKGAHCPYEAKPGSPFCPLHQD